MTGIVAKDWNYNGQSSFKFTSNDNLSNFRIDLPYTNVNDTLEVSFYCLNTEYPITWKVYQLVNDSVVLDSKYMSIPASNNIQHIVTTTTTKETITSIRVLVESSNHMGQNIFIDNIQLNKR